MLKCFDRFRKRTPEQKKKASEEVKTIYIAQLQHPAVTRVRDDIITPWKDEVRPKLKGKN